MPKISLCMIVRDEAQNLPACLESVRDLVSEIIIVDTGSKDATRDVAGAHGAKVFEFPWCDDFAAARNESLRYATGDWVFWMDADDRLDEANRGRFRALAAGLGSENVAYLMRHASPLATREIAVDQERLFRNLPGIRWRNRIHETVSMALQEAGHKVQASDVVISHTGYVDPVAYRAKLERNARILAIAQAESPADPVILYNLGRTQLGLKRFTEALAFLEEARATGKLPINYLRDLHRQCVRALRQLGRPAEALAACRTASAQFPDDADLAFMEAEMLDQAGDLPGAERILQGLLDTSRKWIAQAGGITGYMARQNLGAICRRTNRDAEAETLWGAAVTEKPDFLPGWISLGELYGAHKHWKEAADALQNGLAKARGFDEHRRHAWRRLIRAHTELHRTDLALAACRSARAQLPDDADCCFIESQLLLANGDPLGAQRDLEELVQEGRKWVATDPGILGYKTRQNLGALFMRQGLHAAAEEQFRRVIEEQPGFFLAWGALADVYLAQKRWAEAEGIAEKLTTLPEGRPYVVALRERIARLRAAP